jgi:hypothetical protein
MFRVSTRALLYFDIAIFVILGILINGLFVTCRRKISNKNIYLSVVYMLSLVVGVLSYSDASRISFLGKMPSMELPEIDVYRTVGDMPDGVLMELPYLSPETSAPEASYEYLYNRVGHKKPIANQVYTGSNNTKYTQALHDFSLRVNNLDSALLESLVSNGLKYLAVKDSMNNVLETVSSSESLVLIANDGTTSIFKAKDGLGPKSVDIKTFVYSQIVGEAENL